MQTILLVLLSSSCFVSRMGNAAEGYEEVLISLFQHFSIKKCLILEGLQLSESEWGMAKFLKSFSRMGVASNVVNVSSFLKIATGSIRTNSNTVVAISLNNDSQVQLLVQYSRLITDINLTWMVIVAPGVKTFTDRIHVPVYCQFLIVKPSSNRSTINVNEFYSIGGHRKESLWGTWCIEAKLSVAIKEHLFRRRRDMKEATLIALYIPHPYLTWAFWSNLMEFYNFTATVKTLAELQRIKRKPDAYLVTMAMHPGSFRKDSIGSLGETPYQLHMKRPTEETEFWTSYFRPFTMGAWALVLGTMLLIWIMIPLLKMTVLKMGVQRTKEKFDPVGYGCLTLDTMLGQSGMKAPSMTLSFRIIFFVTVCFAALLQCLYGSELISYLTTHQYLLPFKDLMGLVEDGTYNITYQKKSGQHMSSLLLKGLGPVVGSYVSTHYSEFPGFKRLPEMLCKHRVVYASSSRKDLNAMPWPCENVQIPKPFAVVHIALYLYEDSEFTSAFRYKLPWFRESGNLNFLRLRDQTVNTVHKHKLMVRKYETSDLTEVDSPRIMPVIVLLLVAIAFSICLLLLELLQKKIKIHAVRNQDQSLKLLPSFRKLSSKKIEKHPKLDPPCVFN